MRSAEIPTEAWWVHTRCSTQVLCVGLAQGAELAGECPQGWAGLCRDGLYSQVNMRIESLWMQPLGFYYVLKTIFHLCSF